MEGHAAANLRRQGFGVFLPRRKKTVNHGRKVAVKLAAYFPGYLFVSLDVDRDRWRCVNGTHGVKALLMNGDRPVPAPAGFVETLVASADGAGLIDLSSELGPGSRVRIPNGPFAHLVGLIDGVEGDRRVSILFDIMSSKIPVFVDRASLIEAA